MNVIRRPAANTQPPRKSPRTRRPMESLYRRLGTAGFDRHFVRAHALPDWWDDALAENPANVALAEIAISRTLGFSIPMLHDDDAPLVPPATSATRLKRTAGVEPSSLAPAIVVAERMALNLSPYLRDVPAFTGERTASAVRSEILSRSQNVGLAELVGFAWRSGIFVGQLADRPKNNGRLDGLAMFCDGQPSIVLTSMRDSPPWIAYHLAHELGHLLLGHVRAGDEPIVDGDGDPNDTDAEEQAANAFALEILTGHASPTFEAEYGLTAERLAEAAPNFGAEHRINPGTLALVYGFSAKRMGVAMGALKLLGLVTGGRLVVTNALRAHLERDLPETAERAAVLAGVD